ncbi:MAG TPA: hypothetical protein VFW46_20205 [Stellaceae bacterium]|nr:hypothetical protein [Stellaceae bacterium]
MSDLIITLNDLPIKNVVEFALVGELEQAGQVFELRQVHVSEIGAYVRVVLHRPTMRHIDWIVGRVSPDPAKEIDEAAKLLVGLLEGEDIE